MEKGKGFQLVLLYDRIDLNNEKNALCLFPGLSQYQYSNLIVQYEHFFYPLEYYQRILTAYKTEALRH